jgi:hypothetical protein
MKKIRLRADALEVLSFTTDQQPGVRGTVQAAASGYTGYANVAPAGPAADDLPALRCLPESPNPTPPEGS